MIYWYNRSQQDALFLNFILIYNSTCFRLTVHHKESWYCTHSNGICHTESNISKLEYFGHKMYSSDSMKKDLMLGVTDSSGKYGRQCRWLSAWRTSKYTLQKYINIKISAHRTKRTCSQGCNKAWTQKLSVTTTWRHTMSASRNLSHITLDLKRSNFWNAL